MIVHTEKYIRALREIKFTHIFKWPWLLFIFVLSNSMLSNIKDTLIDTMNGGGIELVPYLKGVFLPIVTILFFAIYKLLSKYFSISTSFYIIYMAFLFYFIFCSLYPPFPQTLSDNSIAVDGKFINAILIIINRYEQTTFYVLAELWETITISLIFIKFFNVSIQNNAPKHIYSILLFFGNLALITSGTTIELVNASFNDWSLAVSYMLYIIIALTTVGLFFCTKLHPAKISFFLEEKKSTYGGPNINRLSICIFILVFSYAALLPITDILWKKNLSLCFKGDPAKYSSFIAMATKYTGISLMILSIFLKPFFLRMRWKQLALLTPITYITLFIPIFLLIEIDNLHVFSAFKDLYLMTSYLGAFQASIFYSLKYIVVAVVKSMSTLKLKKTPHVRSKLFIDIINYKFGNAFSAWVIIFLFSMCKTMELQNIYPYLFLYIIFLLAMWIWTICYLEKHYQKP